MEQEANVDDWKNFQIKTSILYQEAFLDPVMVAFCEEK